MLRRWCPGNTIATAIRAATTSTTATTFAGAVTAVAAAAAAALNAALVYFDLGIEVLHFRG